MSGNITSSRLYAGFAACGLSWIALKTYVVHSFGFNWYIASTDGVVCSVLLASACWLINNNLRYYQPEKGNYLNILIWIGALAAICTFGSRWILPFLATGPAYTQFLLNSLTIRFFTNFLAIGWMAVLYAA